MAAAVAKFKLISEAGEQQDSKSRDPGANKVSFKPAAFGTTPISRLPGSASKGQASSSSKPSTPTADTAASRGQENPFAPGAAPAAAQAPEAVPAEALAAEQQQGQAPQNPSTEVQPELPSAQQLPVQMPHVRPARLLPPPPQPCNSEVSCGVVGLQGSGSAGLDPSSGDEAVSGGSGGVWAELASELAQGSMHSSEGSSGPGPGAAAAAAAANRAAGGVSRQAQATGRHQGLQRRGSSGAQLPGGSQQQQQQQQGSSRFAVQAAGGGVPALPALAVAEIGSEGDASGQPLITPRDFAHAIPPIDPGEDMRMPVSSGLEPGDEEYASEATPPSMMNA